MTTAESTAASGAVLGGAAVLLAQQFGLLALSELGPTLFWVLTGVLLGGLAGGAAGWAVDRR